jgi:ABC-type branched-subunit amino acid transport system permease subunit
VKIPVAAAVACGFMAGALIGALFVLVTMFLPRGLVGLVPARQKNR